MWNDLVMMPTSESRIAYAHIRPAVQAFCNALARDLPGKLRVIDTREALDAGCGGQAASSRDPLPPGRLVLLATGDGWLADSTGQMPDFRGMHGGLTAERCWCLCCGCDWMQNGPRWVTSRKRYYRVV
jgi:hypothetical protein